METMAKVGQITSYDAFYPTYKEWKLICRCYLVNAEFLFILPIRNGNNNEYRNILFCILSFYPTYKEWKQDDGDLCEGVCPHAFYPTYKEWKL